MGRKIRFLTGTGGFRGPSYRTGQIIDDAPEAFMKAMVRRGIAEWVGDPEPAQEQKETEIPPENPEGDPGTGSEPEQPAEEPAQEQKETKGKTGKKKGKK